MLGEARPAAVADGECGSSPMWSGRIMPRQGAPEIGGGGGARRGVRLGEAGGRLLWASPLARLEAFTLSSRAEVKHIGSPRPFKEWMEPRACKTLHGAILNNAMCVQNIFLVNND